MKNLDYTKCYSTEQELMIIYNRLLEERKNENWKQKVEHNKNELLKSIPTTKGECIRVSNHLIKFDILCDENKNGEIVYKGHILHHTSKIEVTTEDLPQIVYAMAQNHFFVVK